VVAGGKKPKYLGLERRTFKAKPAAGEAAARNETRKRAGVGGLQKKRQASRGTNQWEGGGEPLKGVTVARLRGGRGYSNKRGGNLARKTNRKKASEDKTKRGKEKRTKRCWSGQDKTVKKKEEGTDGK